MKSIDQITIARLIANKTGLPLMDVQEVISLEQKFTMDSIKRGKKVVKENYIILTPSFSKERVLKCPIDGKEYVLPEKKSVTVKVSKYFKNYIADGIHGEEIC